ncbi:unnamed protein product [Vitrella brassicaformis CCMP3155]|uniref:GPN-loop GTPase 3 n=1 Tax=Vitrella brassicaformis (strain CCMP3155) TaxID=1169540 RepID=A0A0G4ESS5_VITBC|nr:unnamed protein product [Vitrella brassicaformis CCMP3155]|eukprot:CEM00756.1 unnamed protein product [Vitrella brassicaformis CCMP3155]
MVRFGQVVIGPAGCGKSTYCAALTKHAECSGRLLRCVNLDPAAEEFEYPCAIDVRELVTLEDVMEESNLGPNGGLVFAMEYLIDNFDWLQSELDQFGDDEYFLFDCPGQIELYNHLPIMRQLVDKLQTLDFRLCGVCCLDVSFITDIPKFIAGSLMALSAMVQLELPHVNVLTKCDLLEESDREQVDRYLQGEPRDLVAQVQGPLGRYHDLNRAMGELLEDYSMVSFLTLNIQEPDSIDELMQHIDTNIQYGEDLETKGNFDLGAIPEEGEGQDGAD